MAAAPNLSDRQNWTVDDLASPRPDVVVLRPDHVTVSPVPVEDAILAVEIISPESRFRDMYAKAKVYAAAGVAHYWVIDPMHDEGIVLSEFRPGTHGDYEMVASTNKFFTTGEPYPVTLDLPALTVRRQAIIERARPQS